MAQYKSYKFPYYDLAMIGPEYDRPGIIYGPEYDRPGIIYGPEYDQPGIIYGPKYDQPGIIFVHLVHMYLRRRLPQQQTQRCICSCMIPENPHKFQTRVDVTCNPNKNVKILRTTSFKG